MVHFSQTSLMSDVPLATSLPTTFTFHPNHQVADPSVVQQQQQQQSIPSSTASSSSTKQHKQKQRSTSSDDQNSSNNQQTSGNDYETRLRCPNCETWVVNLSDHLRKTHRIASSVDRKPLLRMARLEKRRMAETVTHSPPTAAPVLKSNVNSTVLINGLSTTHANTNEIENLLFKHQHDPTNFAVTLPENILLNQQMTSSIAHFAPTIKRQHSLDEHLEQNPDGLLTNSAQKKARLAMIDGTKVSQTIHSSSSSSATTKSSKKNRNKQQQQQQQATTTTITKVTTSGIFPQQSIAPHVAVPTMEDSADDLSKVLQMMGNEMNFLNQHLQTTSLQLQKQLELARDSLHACTVQFAHLKRMIQPQI